LSIDSQSMSGLNSHTILSILSRPQQNLLPGTGPYYSDLSDRSSSELSGGWLSNDGVEIPVDQGGVVIRWVIQKACKRVCEQCPGSVRASGGSCMVV
jgi:hypothetical protein